MPLEGTTARPALCERCSVGVHFIKRRLGKQSVKPGRCRAAPDDRSALPFRSVAAPASPYVTVRRMVDRADAWPQSGAMFLPRHAQAPATR
ncbi:hypothetical protein F8B43_3300 [Methylorubrum populi]|uniref:Uncharacterized protein n=1 Tax=Methylorubrum populi TaxID=223967 RepID=A0A833J809_9HYPH|nr:hypothetical protein F8B43_3300 [Methylorubrum populi]